MTSTFEKIDVKYVFECWKFLKNGQFTMKLHSNMTYSGILKGRWSKFLELQCWRHIFFFFLVILDKWFIKKTILSAPYRSNHIPTACVQKEKNSWKSGGPTTVRFVFCCAPLRQLLSNGAATATKTEKYSCKTVNYKHTKVVKYFFKPVNYNIQITDVNST